MDRRKRVKLVLLWHMHQPCYRNGVTREYEMPWVFLHSIKDYFDMPYQAGRFKNLKLTFNLTPILVEQIQEYASGRADCRFLKLIKKPVKELQPIEKEWLLNYMFHINPETMIKPFKQYYELLLRFEREGKEKFLRNIPNQDFLNLEVLFLLAWCGKYLREKNETVKKLILKESVFTEEEKLKLLEELIEFMGEIVPLYQKLKGEGKIEVTTTPYYHPILPLLININSAKESSPQVRLPALHVNFEDDAEVHLERALQLSKSLFGSVEGVWPAEGGISEESLKLKVRKGVKWCATDEEILFRSLSERSGTREPLYKVYSFKGVKILFRDRELSDLIGFVYKGWNEDEAVEDFLNRLKRIAERYPNPTVTVILDGENCWELYRDNGHPFREKLYKTLSEIPWIETVLPSHLEPEKELRRLVAGSWVGGNFLTWVGDPEKNRAWELLGIAKLNVERRRESRNYEKARELLLTAEGSDWFWWFGKGHYSRFLKEFDKLFRSNLIGAYRLVEKPVPQELLSPISRFRSQISIPPKSFIKAVIDGQVTNYYEWLNAGHVDLLEFSSMERGSFIMERLFYGYDPDGNLYLRIDGRWEKLKGKNFQLEFEFTGTKTKKISVTSGRIEGCTNAEVAFDRILELRIGKECLEGILGNKGRLIVKLLVEGRLVEEAPLFSVAILHLDRDFSTEWMV